MTAAQRRIDALDVPVAALEARLRAGRRAEYGHLLHDADEDSTVPTFPDLAKGRVVDADFARSVADGFESPVVWGAAPVYPRRTVDAPRSAEDVQTGGAL